jgi:hypothetical protein
MAPLSAASILSVALVSGTAAAALPAGYVRVPGGAMHESCVHAHAHGARLVEAELPRCPHPFVRGEGPSAGGGLLRGGMPAVGAGHGSAWKSWSQFALGGAADSVTSLISTWAVPPEPGAAGRAPGITLFWWNGVEPADTSAVLQPVIQFGSSAAGGGEFWAYSSWYVSAAHGSHFSPLVKLQAGDLVTGSNVVDASGDWNITSSAPQRAPTTLSFTPVPGAWATAYHVLEAYGVTNNCDAYPSVGAVNFTGVSLAISGKPVSPIKWVDMTQSPVDCKEKSTANKAGDVVSNTWSTK